MMLSRCGKVRIPVLMIAVLVSLSGILLFRPVPDDVVPRSVPSSVSVPAALAPVSDLDSVALHETAASPPASPTPSDLLREKFPALSRRAVSTAPTPDVDVVATLHENYIEGLAIECRGARLRQTLLGARSSARTGDAREATYPNVLPGIDAIVACESNRVEEFLHLGANASSDFTYSLTVESPTHAIRNLEGLFVTDHAGTSLLRLDPVVYWEAGDPEPKGAIARIDVTGPRTALLSISIPEESRGREILLDPSWSYAASMSRPRVDHLMSLLSNGNVLVTGGYRLGTTAVEDGSKFCEIYNPSTNTFSATGSMKTGRRWHTSTRLNDGRVLVTGGSYYKSAAGTIVVASCEIYNPANGTWTTTGSMSLQRFYHSATLLADGRVFVYGGWNLNDRKPVDGRAEIFNPATGVWTSTSPSSPSGAVIYNYNSGCATLTNGLVLVLIPYSTFQLFNPTTGTWSATLNSPTAEYNAKSHLVALPSGKVLHVSVQQCDLYDPATNSWSTTGSLSAMRTEKTVTALSNGNVLVAGGGWGVQYNSCELYDASTGMWNMTVSSRRSRAGAAAVLLPNGQVLVTGGAEGYNVYSTCELYTP